MINRPAARPLSQPQPGDSDAGQLLKDFVNRVPGADSAVLAERDPHGALALAFAGTTADRADCLALRINALVSNGTGVGPLTGTEGGFQQQTTELEGITMLLMGIDPLASSPVCADRDLAPGGWLLAVLYAPETGDRVAGEAKTLRKQVAGRLVEPLGLGAAIGAA